MTPPDPHTQPSYRGAITMMVLVLVVIAVVWLLFVNVLDSDFGRGVYVPDAGPGATSTVDQPVP